MISYRFSLYYLSNGSPERPLLCSLPRSMGNGSIEKIILTNGEIRGMMCFLHRNAPVPMPCREVRHCPEPFPHCLSHFTNDHPITAYHNRKSHKRPFEMRKSQGRFEDLQAVKVKELFGSIGRTHNQYSKQYLDRQNECIHKLSERFFPVR